jgi:hypothetical protein
MVANTVGGPSVVLGAGLLGVVDDRQLAFALAQQLTYLRPGYFLCRLFPSPSQLRLVVLATIKLVVPGVALAPADALEVGKLVEQLATAFAQTGVPQQLAALARPFCEGTERLDLVPWWNAVGLTANRAGFLLCDDLQLAVQTVQLEPSPFGSMSSSEKARELIGYSISPEYFELRRQLGLGQ